MIRLLLADDHQVIREGLRRLFESQRDIEVVVATAAPQPEDVLAPEDAIGHLLPDLLANRPYVITHGSAGAAVDERHRELGAAFRRMNAARRPIRD